MTSLNYDSEYDVLYVKLGDKNNSYGDEIIDGFIVMRDILSEQIAGFTIFDFVAKLEKYKDLLIG